MIQPPAQPQGPLQQAQGAASLAGLLQQQRIQQQMAPGQMQLQQQAIQQGQQEQQLRQIQIQDASAGQKALQSWDGKDPDQLPDLIRQNGGSFNAVMGARQGILSMKTAAQKLQTDQLDNLGKTNDIIAGHFESVKGAQDKPAAFDAAVSDLEQKRLIQPGQIPHQYPGDDQLNLLEKQFMTQKSIVDQEQKNREETEKEWKDFPQLGTLVNTRTGEVRNVAGNTMTPAMMESKYVDITSRQNQGQKISPDEQSFVKAYKGFKEIVPQFQFNLATGGGINTPAAPGQPGGPGGPALTAAQTQGQRVGLAPAALDQSAQNYLQTGTMPAIRGGGAAASLQQKAIMNRAAELDPNGNISANKDIQASYSDALKGLQKNFSNVSSFENTAGKNLDLFLSTAKKVVDSGSPWINTPLRAVDANALGSADQAAFNAARTTALTEIAKVLNSSNASGVLSDSARGEVSQLIGPNATLQQIISASNILKQDMANRHQSYQDQINDLQGKLRKTPTQSGNTAQTQSPSAQGFKVPAGAPAAPAEDGHKLKQGGTLIAVSKGGQWVAPPSQ